MKPISLSLLNTIFGIVLVGAYFSNLNPVRAGDKQPLVFGMISAEKNASARETRLGYLKVYSATDEFNDGEAWYFPHSSYIVYTINGKLVMRVENHISRSDEVPEMVILPIGSYTVEARSEQDGYVRIAVIIKEGHQTILHLDMREQKPLDRLVHK